MSATKESPVTGFSLPFDSVAQPDDSVSNISATSSRRSMSSTASFKRKESRVKLRLARLARIQEVERSREAEKQSQTETEAAEIKRKAALREADRRLAMAELEAAAWEEESEQGSCFEVLDETGSRDLENDSKGVTWNRCNESSPFVKLSRNLDEFKPCASDLPNSYQLPKVCPSEAKPVAVTRTKLMQPPPGFSNPVLVSDVEKMVYHSVSQEPDCSYGSTKKLPESKQMWSTPFTPGFNVDPRDMKGPEVPEDHVAKQKTPQVQQGDITESMRVIAGVIRDGFDAPRRSTPTFSGDPLRFFEFVKSFEDVVTRQVPDTTRQLGFLLECCVGEPHDLILPCASMDSLEGLTKAKELLFRQYGQRHVLVDANVRRLMGPEIKPEGRKLQELANNMLSCQLTLRAWNYHSSLNSQELILSVLKRLPKYLQREFHGKARKRMAENQEVTFEDLTAFGQEKASMANDFIGRSIAADTKNPKQSIAAKRHNWEPKRQASVFCTQEEKADTRQSTINTAKQAGTSIACPDCNGRHPLWKCEAFRKKNVTERWKIARDKMKSVCFKCLAVGYMSKE